MTEPPEDQRGETALPDLESIMRMIDRSAYREEVRDVPGRRRRIFEALARSDDPVWREMGEQLRDGRMELRDVARVDAYWQKVQQGLAEHGEEFRDAAAEAVQHLEQAENEQQDPGRDR